MRGGKRRRIEQAVDCAAATAFAGAVGFCLFELLVEAAPPPYRAPLAACSAVGAFLLSFRFLRRLGGKVPSFEVPEFPLRELRFEELGELLLTEQVELLLTDADRLRPSRSAEEELVLNDILAKLGPDSRVVRLFDATAMPTPAQLNDRIERHLRASAPPAGPPDASDALYQALNELRRSLR